MRPSTPRSPARASSVAISAGVYQWWSANWRNCWTLTPAARSVSSNARGAAIPAECWEANRMRLVSLAALRRRGDGGQDRDLGRVRGDGAEDFGGVLPALDTGGDDQVRTAERCERLSQRPRRQELAIAPRVLRARHHDLEVFLERAVLERVVEDDRGYTEPVEREARRVVAVRAHDHRHARQATREQERLVARPLGVEPDRRRVGDDPDATGAAAVAATDDRGPVPEGRERLHRDLHRRRLARAADRQVADRDHGHRERARLEDAALIEPLARAEEATVPLARGAEEPPLGGRKPILPSPHEPRAARLHTRSPGARKRPTSSSVSRTAPWREATAPYPASPVFALSPAPADSRSAADSRKFCVCGPMSTGFRLSAGSSMLWPPKGTRLPPTKTTSATA